MNTIGKKEMSIEEALKTPKMTIGRPKTHQNFSPTAN